ncbi:MAG: hypothetical protein SGPRY_001452 [Prymnesium sp.]
MRGCISIGLADGHFLLNRRPGWEAHSYAYLGEDGKRYHDCERGEPYGPTFGAGDVVGCGLLCERREIFFTKNGEHLGVAFSDVTCSLYPTVSLHSPNEALTVNLGASPFKFDVEALLREQRREKLMQARLATSMGRRRHTEELTLPIQRCSQVAKYQIPSGTIPKLVEAYLLHYTYDRTLHKLRESTGEAKAEGGPSHTNEAISKGGDGEGGVEEMENQTGMVVDEGAEQQDRPGNGCDSGWWESHHKLEETVELRRALRARVLGGDVEGAFKLCEQRCPGLLDRHTHAQADASQLDLLRDVFALVAYEDPEREDSPVSYLMQASRPHFITYDVQPGQRHATAAALNGAVLQEHGLSSTSGKGSVLDANLGYGEPLSW